MRVDDPDERMDNPGECDDCGYLIDDLERFSHCGPGYQVSWLCKYCAVSHAPGDDIGRTLAGMFHVLEKTIIDKMDEIKNETTNK